MTLRYPAHRINSIEKYVAESITSAAAAAIIPLTDRTLVRLAFSGAGTIDLEAGTEDGLYRILIAETVAGTTSLINSATVQLSAAWQPVAVGEVLEVMWNAAISKWCEVARSPIASGGGSPAIGGTITGGTANSILFVNPAATIAQDNPSFTYDTATNNISLTSQAGMSFNANDVGDIINSYNTSAGSANQFFINHNLANVELGNARGNSIVTAGNLGINVNPTQANFAKFITRSSAGNLIGLTENAGLSSIIAWDDSGTSNTLRLAGSPLVMTGDGGSGAEHVRVTAAGDVGIGTVPTQKLHVAGETLINGGGSLRLQTTTPGTDGILKLLEPAGTLRTSIYYAGTDLLRIADTTTDRLVIDSTGDVGIGTNSPTAKLQVKSSGEIISLETTAATGENYLRYKNAITNLGYIGYGSSTDNNLYIINESTSSDIAFATNGPSSVTEKMRILSAGNVGIGTSTPSSKLHIAGGTGILVEAVGSQWAVLGSDVAGANYMTLRRPGSTAALGYIGGGGGGSISGGTSSDLAIRSEASLYIATNGNVPQVIVDTSGNVGIGDFTPAAKLSVGATSEFQVNSTGDIVKINNVITTFPAAQGAANTILKNDGAGTLTWSSDYVTSSTAPSVDNALVRYDGTTGKIIQSGSGVILSDTGQFSRAGNINITTVGAGTDLTCTAVNNLQLNANNGALLVGSNTASVQTFLGGIALVSATDVTVDAVTNITLDATTQIALQNTGTTKFTVDGTALQGVEIGLPGARRAPYIRSAETAVSQLQSPIYSFVTDQDTGMTSSSDNTVSLVTDAASRVTIDTAAITSTLPHLSINGTVTAPAYSFSASPDSGMWATTKALNFSVSASGVMSLLSTAGGDQIQSVPDGVLARPAYSFLNSNSTGMRSPSVNNLSLTSNGADALHIDASQYVGLGTATPETKLEIAGTEPYITMPTELTSASPTSPTANKLILIGQRIANRGMLAVKGAVGHETALQPYMGHNKVGLYSAIPGQATLPAANGISFTTQIGTLTARTPFATPPTANALTYMHRYGIVSTATLGAITHQRTGTAAAGVGYFFTGNGPVINRGGFVYTVRFAVSDATIVTAARMFVGLRNSTAVPTNLDPSTFTQQVGIAQYDGTTQLYIVYGGTAPQTPINLGASFVASNTTPYELALYAPSDAANTVYYEVTNLDTGVIATGTLSGSGTIVPGGTVALTGHHWRSNNTSTAAVALDISQIYTEMDQ